MNGGAEADGAGSMSLAAQRAAASQRRRRDSGTDSDDADGVKASGRSAGAAATACRGASACHPARAAATDRLAGTDEAGGGSSEDEAFMQRFRAERLRQMRLRVGLGLPVYGGVVEIEDRLELPGAIDASEPSAMPGDEKACRVRQRCLSHPPCLQLTRGCTRSSSSGSRSSLPPSR